jgi:hypothetical protein
MSDDAFYSPNYRPPPRVPRPGEPLWSIRKDHVTWSCELRYHGEWGVEAAIYRDAEFARSRRFDLRALAVQWAEQEREHIERGGDD